MKNLAGIKAFDGLVAVLLGLLLPGRIFAKIFWALLAYYMLLAVQFRSFRTAFILTWRRRSCSRAIGALSRVYIPRFLRSAVYGLWIALFDVDTTDFDTPLQDFASLAAFFNRRIKRMLVQNAELAKVDANTIYAPADSTFSLLNEFTDRPNCCVKGANFTFEQLTREAAPTETQGAAKKRIYFAVYYLSPGDFHDFVSFNQFAARRIRLISGDFLPVNQLFMTKYDGCLAVNERIVIEGSFAGRRVWYVAVAALNVGNIVVYNGGMRSYQQERSYPHEYDYHTGQEIGQFKLGSTVVVCFETESDERVEIIQQGKVRFGTPTVRITRKAAE